ncbi:MAG: hypothetical protein L7U87_05865 [Chlamydiales bacterium]|nr:hypothetical protein [Chlamydiales bacterium]
MSSKKGTILSGALMVSGVSIGASMLAMPVQMGQAGFIPTIILHIVCWALMTLTGLLYVEACLWFKKEVNILTLTHETLGGFAKSFIWLVYLFLFFSLTVAYTTGGGEILVNISQGMLNPKLGSIVFVVLFLPIIFKGAFLVDRVNQLFMAILMLSFLFFIFVGLGSINISHLSHSNHYSSLQGLPVVLTAFGFQGLVPTLVEYLGRDRKSLVLSIILGSLMSFAIYLVWITLIFGLVPLEGESGLLALNAQGKTAVASLFLVTNNPLVFSFGQAFALSALVTSFLGVALPLVDFLADGFKVEKQKGFNKLWLSCLVLIPTLLISVVDPSIFIKALSVAGAYGGTIILGLLPISIVWVGRRKFQDKTAIIRNKLVLAIAFLCIVFVIVTKILGLGV